MAKVRPYNMIGQPEGRKVGPTKTMHYASLGAVEQQIEHSQTEEMGKDYYFEPHYAKRIKYGTKSIEV